MNKYRTLIILVSLIVCTFAAYGNAIFNTFVLDDQAFIVENPFIRNILYFPDLFQKNLNQLSSWGRSFEAYYRPLFLASFMLDYHFWGLNPKVFHFHNILLHALCTILVFFCAKQLFDNEFCAGMSALFFCLHPIHTEAVTAVFNRMDVFVTCLSLGAFLFYCEFLKSNTRKFYMYIGSLVLFFIALFAKEFAVMLPLILFTYDYLFFERSIINIIRKRWLYFVGFAAILLFYMLFRSAVLGKFASGYANQPIYTSFQKTDLALLPAYITFQSLALYFKKLILPINLNAVYYFSLTRHLNLEVFFAVAIVAMSVFYVFFYKARNKAAAFCIAWFYIMIFPVLHIIPFGRIVAEHYTYVASVGFCCLCGYASYLLYRQVVDGRIKWLKRSTVILLLLAVSLFYLYQTIIRNYDWRTDLTLWKSSVKLHPLKSTPYANLANAYARIGEQDQAEKYYLKALAIQADSPEALNSLGALYVRQGKMQRGIELMYMALRIAPNNSLIYRNIGRTHNLMGDFGDAVRHLKMASSLNPGRLELYYDLGLAYVNKGSYQNAENEFNKARTLDNSYANAYYGLGLANFKQGKEKEAQKYFREAIKLDPNLQVAFERLTDGK